jgi:tRNA threonylcarbamoyl adenosine modification protein (Sua5/YciO/YrdC/YwlC family)
MPQVINWRGDADPASVVRRAVHALARGEVVAFPTETVYGVAASALLPEAVQRLVQGKGRAEGKPLTLAVATPASAPDWVPGISPLGRRLARRCWPGPVTLVFADGVEQGLAGRLPGSVRRRVCASGTLGLRIPDHEAIAHVLHAVPGPLVLTSANHSGEEAATTPREVLEALGDDLALVIDDGPTRYGKASTVVRVNGSRWEVLREGALSAAELRRQSACLVAFVCTGNTCRSPMAEALCKRLLAQRLGCEPAELPERGFVVISAGMAAMMGDGAAPEAVEAARELGGDLTAHASRPLTPDLVEQADFLVAMTRGHMAALSARYATPGARPRLLSGDGEDIPDPIGCDQQVYRECAQQILRRLEALVPELQQP